MIDPKVFDTNKIIYDDLVHRVISPKIKYTFISYQYSFFHRFVLPVLQTYY